MEISLVSEKVHQAINSTKDIVSKIKFLSEILKEVLGVDRCTLFIYDVDTDSFWSAYIDGISFIEIPNGKGLVSHVFKTKKLQIFNDVKKEVGHFPGVDARTGYYTKSMLTIPVINYENRALGVVQLLNKLDESDFTEDDAEVMKSVIQQFVEFVEVGIVKK